MKVLIDTNVLIDFLTKRNQTFYESAGKIINYCFCKKIKGCNLWEHMQYLQISRL